MTRTSNPAEPCNADISAGNENTTPKLYMPFGPQYRMDSVRSRCHPQYLLSKPHLDSKLLLLLPLKLGDGKTKRAKILDVYIGKVTPTCINLSNNPKTFFSYYDLMVAKSHLN